MKIKRKSKSKSKSKNKNSISNKAIKEELFKPYILTQNGEAVLDTSIDVTPAKLGEINIKVKKGTVVYERCKHCGRIFQSDKKCKYCQDISKKCWKDYNENWKNILEKGGKIDMEQLVRELSDYSDLMDTVTKVYDHITHGKLSELNYDASTIIKEADDSYERLIEGMVKDDIRDIIGMNDHPCAETDIDRLDEIERYIDTLKE